MMLSMNELIEIKELIEMNDDWNEWDELERQATPLIHSMNERSQQLIHSINSFILRTMNEISQPLIHSILFYIKEHILYKRTHSI